MSVRRLVRAGRHGVASLALGAALMAAPGIGASQETSPGTPSVTDVSLRAAFIFNIVKFTEWPALAAGAPIVLCVVGADGIATALGRTTGGREIKGHGLEVRRPEDSGTWRVCQVLFIAAAELERSAAELERIRPLPVLTISDRRGFSQGLGMIELVDEGGRLRFGIDRGAVERAGIRMNPTLLKLALPGGRAR